MKHIIGSCLILATAGLSACGCSPIYGGTGGIETSNSTIYVNEIPGRSGHALRKELVLLLNRGLPGVSEAVLEIDYEDDIRRVAFRPEESSSRSDAVAEATYRLFSDGRELEGKTSARVSFNVPTDSFADIAAQVDAQERVARIIAQQIVDDLTVQIIEESAQTDGAE